MAVSDDRRRLMPAADDRSTGKKLAYPEAVLLTNPSNNDLKGEVIICLVFILFYCFTQQFIYLFFNECYMKKKNDFFGLF